MYGIDVVNFLCTADGLCADFGESKISDLPLSVCTFVSIASTKCTFVGSFLDSPLQLGHGMYGLLNRSLSIDPMAIIQIDGANTQPL